MQVEDIRLERDVRQPDQPPVDGLAECVVLHACVYEPSLIDQFDVGRLLVHAEHREIWRVLKMTRARTRHRQAAEFLCEFYLDLSAEHPDKWCYYDDLLTSVSDRETARAWQEYQDDNGGMPFSTFLHDFCWWLRRLQRIHDARKGIQALQQAAEALWRVPDHDVSNDDVVGLVRRALPSDGLRIDL